MLKLDNFTIPDIFYWLFIAVIVVNLLQRRHREKAEKKRYATLYIAMTLLILYVGALTIERYSLSWWCSVLLVGVAAIFVYLLRKKIAVFRFRDEQTKEFLPLSEILFRDIDYTADAEQDE